MSSTAHHPITIVQGVPTAVLGYDFAGCLITPGCFLRLKQGTAFYRYAEDCGIDTDTYFWAVDSLVHPGDPSYVEHIFPGTGPGFVLTCDNHAMLLRGEQYDGQSQARVLMQESDVVVVAPPMVVTNYENDMHTCRTGSALKDQISAGAGMAVKLSAWGRGIALDLMQRGRLPAGFNNWGFEIAMVRPSYLDCRPVHHHDRAELVKCTGRNKIYLNHCDLLSATSSVIPPSPVAAATTSVTDKNGAPLAVGDYVTIDPVVLNAMPTLATIVKVSDEFELCPPVAGTGADFTLLAVDPSLQVMLKGIKDPLSAAGYALLFVRARPVSAAPTPFGFIPPATAPVAAATAPFLYGNGQDIMVGDIVVLTYAAVSSWGSAMGLDRIDEFVVVGMRPAEGLVDTLPVDPVKQNKLYLQLGGELELEPAEMILRRRSAPPVMATHYAPCALPTGDPDTGEKYFDHASLGTDLTGDELMKSIRDFCECNGYV